MNELWSVFQNTVKVHGMGQMNPDNKEDIITMEDQFVQMKVSCD